MKIRLAHWAGIEKVVLLLIAVTIAGASLADPFGIDGIALGFT